MSRTARWVINRIDEDAIELICPTDSADRRRVTRDYAREHVQLAYASTVYGIQGDTADASLVAPDVNAAGLYVGMTRGRECNQFVTIAKSDALAVPVVAATMLRGALEASIGDAVEAAQAELRAAPTGLPSDPGGESFARTDSRTLSR